jgi:SNF2 family DNA or RNA helicase
LGLTEDLKKSLQKLKYISDSSENKLHKLAMSSVLDLEKAGAAVGKDSAWQEYIDKLKTFNKLKIKLPKNFTAQLRDYQYEGFVWLSRLAYLGAGACLADDMGLGKTVQTIALMASQAKAKPCLVIAPTSVVSNWQAELDKFTTGLNSIILSELGAQNDKRKELISSLKPGDILLCSYGLLQTQIDLLKEVEFSMVVLDESQAIKNPLTKRAQAAKLLKADFRLVLSGTPIENNLTELWSQFDFINPGLLSSLKNFQGKFANAIEINKDKVAQASLKQLIQPYILRRTKNEVLQDLPPKIEQTIRIEFDPDEAAFYEVLRQKAIDKLENSQEDNVGKRKLQILAEMSKLRRACCHPSLVEAPGEYVGSKNKEFLELVTNLKSNSHKALVFSQYTSYLKLLAQSLDLMELNYLYLDGSTPAKKRKELVKEFQTGNADLFLLSLKAGGSGLNLTEADYVIHLDPWWNPAVEDQATDRAHRIGQNKTVNVYRLIMKSTIEEKILKLHDTKRELADELLSDADMTAKLSDKELLEMMKG